MTARHSKQLYCQSPSEASSMQNTPFASQEHTPASGWVTVLCNGRCSQHACTVLEKQSKYLRRHAVSFGADLTDG